MKKIVLISISMLMLTLVSCKKKGVCTCQNDGTTTKTYYEDLSVSEKKYVKRNCNGDSDARIVKTEATTGGTTVTSEFGIKLTSYNCEWSRKGE